MSRTVTYIKAPPPRVFDVLEDAQSYAYWVVGCKRIRAVEPAWPAEGSAFHHTIGVGPVATRDKTTVVRNARPHRLELEAHGWPAGQARVIVTVAESGAGSRVEMVEEPTRGPARWLHNPLLDAAAHARNTIALRRLARLAERRA